MPFANVDDNFAEHPKIDALPDSAFRLHISGILYCNRYLTDGIVPVERVPRLVPRYRAVALELLVNRALWQPLGDDPFAYEIHDFLQWNRSRAEVEKLRESGRRNAAKRWTRRNGGPPADPF